MRTWSLDSAELAEGLPDVFDECLGILPGHEVAARLVGLGVDRTLRSAVDSRLPCPITASPRRDVAGACNGPVIGAPQLACRFRVA